VNRSESHGYTSLHPVNSKPHSGAASPPRKQPIRWGLWRLGALAWGAVLGGIGSGSLPAQAAERLTVKLGPLQQNVTVQELHQYAETGDVPDSLRLYGWLLNDQAQVALTTRLPLEPTVGREVVGDLLSSSAGDRLLKTLQAVLPQTSQEELYQALTEAATQPEGLTFLGFMEALPQKQVTIDLTALFTLASEMNLPYWQSQSFSSILERELTVPQAATFSNKFDPTQNGYLWVRRQTMVLRDRDRHRTIPVDLYWSRYSSGPLIVISHGFGADRRFMGYLAYHLASHGFTVAALEHPGSNVAWLSAVISGRVLSNRFMNLLPASEFIDRPRDVSFLLSELQHINSTPGHLRNKLNAEDTIVIGHSLGGYTALALAGAKLNLNNLRQFCNGSKEFGLSVADWLQCTAVDLPENVPDLRDRRVRRIIMLNPLIGRLFDQTSLEHNVRIPTLMVASTADAITPAISQQLLPYTHLQGEERYLLTAIGATHLSVGDPANLNPALSKSLFARERGNNETEGMRRLLQGVTLAFAKQETADAIRYRPFLSPAYAQSFSNADVKLRLNTSVPPKLSNWLEMAAMPLEQMTLTPGPEQPQKVRVLKATYAGITFLLLGIPVAMFILPSSLMSAARFFRQTRQETPPPDERESERP